ncbi:hypothetical protein P9112_006765 [Eukaryota sp. TZLM1-RC]
MDTDCPACAELLKEVEDLYSNLESVEEQLRSSSSKNKQLEAHNQTLQNNFSEERFSLQERINALQEEVTSLRGAKDAAALAVQDVTASDQILRSRLSQVNKELSEALENLNEVTQERDDIIKTEKSTKVKFNELTSELESVQNQNAFLTDELEKEKSGNQGLIREINKLEKEIKNQQDQCFDVSEQNSKLIEMNNELVDQIDDAESRHQSLILEYETKISALEKTIKDNDHLIAAQKSVIDDYKVTESQATFEREVNHLRAEVDRLQEENEQFASTVDDQSKIIDDLQTSLDQLKSKDTKSDELDNAELYHLITELEKQIHYKDELVLLYKNEAQEIASQNGFEIMLSNLEELRVTISQREEDIIELRQVINDLEYFIRLNGLKYSGSSSKYIKIDSSMNTLDMTSSVTKNRTKQIGINTEKRLLLDGQIQTDFEPLVNKSPRDIVEKCDQVTDCSLSFLGIDASVETIKIDYMDCGVDSLDENVESLLTSIDLLLLKFENLDVTRCDQLLIDRLAINSKLITFLKQYYEGKIHLLQMEYDAKIEIFDCPDRSFSELFSTIDKLFITFSQYGLKLQSKSKTKLTRKEFDQVINLISHLSNQNLQSRSSDDDTLLNEAQQRINELETNYSKLKEEFSIISSQLILASHLVDFQNKEKYLEEINQVVTENEYLKKRIHELEVFSSELSSDPKLKFSSQNVEFFNILPLLFDLLYFVSLTINCSSVAFETMTSSLQNITSSAQNSDSDDESDEEPSKRHQLEILSLNQEISLLKTQISSLFEVVSLQENALSECLKNLAGVDVFTEFLQVLQGQTKGDQTEEDQKIEEDQKVSSKTSHGTTLSKSFSSMTLPESCQSCQSLKRLVEVKNKSIERLTEILNQLRSSEKLRVSMILSESQDISPMDSVSTQVKSTMKTVKSNELSESLLIERTNELTSLRNEFKNVTTENSKLRRLVTSQGNELAELKQDLYKLESHGPYPSMERLNTQLREKLSEKEGELNELKKVVNKLLKRLKKVQAL